MINYDEQIAIFEANGHMDSVDSWRSLAENLRNDRGIAMSKMESLVYIIRDHAPHMYDSALRIFDLSATRAERNRISGGVDT